MTGTGVAVVADDAVGDEVPGFRGDVVETHRLQRLDADDAQTRVALDRQAGDVELAGNRWADRVEEAQVLAQATGQSDDVDGFPALVVDMFHDKPETKDAQTPANPINYYCVGVGNAQDRLAETSLRVEYPREKTCGPFLRGTRRPGGQAVNRLNAQDGSGSYRMQRPPCTHRRLEQESAGRYLEVEQIVAGPYQSFLIAQREAKFLRLKDPAIPALIIEGTKMAITSDHPAEITAAIILVLHHRLRKCTSPHELVQGCEVRSAGPALLGSSHELPAAIAEETMVAASDEPCAVL